MPLPSVEREQGAVSVSLIICTKNRASRLPACLHAVARIPASSAWEFVVVDNGSIDATAEVIRQFAREAPFPVVYVYEGGRGNSRGRNAGIAASAGSILAFTDDDCYIRPDHLCLVQQIFDDPQIGFACGPIVPYDPVDDPKAMITYATSRVWLPRSFVAAGTIGGGNMAFRRDAIEQVGGFDPLFGSGARFAGEECDIAARISLRGWKGAYSTAIVVAHHHGTSTHDESAARFYDMGRGAYHAKLLLKGRSPKLFLRAWTSLRWRMAGRRSTGWWELVGALRYVAVLLSGGDRKVERNPN